MLPLDPSSYGGLPGLGMQGIMDLMLQFFTVSLRIGSFLLASPIFGSRMVPLPIRIVFSMALTLFIYQLVPSPDLTIMTSTLAIGVIWQEIAVGLSAGLILTILFSAASIAGEQIATTAGLSFAAQADPNTGASSPVLAQIFMLFLTTLFLSVNGHLVALDMIIKSYQIAFAVLIQTGIDSVSVMFEKGALFMLPVSGVLLMVNITIGIITKSAPQLSLFSFGFPLTLMTSFILLFLFVYPLAAAMQGLFDTTLQIMGLMLKEAANG
jgi:flagellar biosynthesis protein FliR